MIFTNKARGDIYIHVDGERLKESEHEKFLGVIIDFNLNWAHHIKNLATKVSRNAGVLYKLKGIVPDNTLKLIYNSFIQSHLYYCATVWGTRSLNSISKVFSAQKKGIRAADNKYHAYRYNKETKSTPAHTKDIFNKLELLALPNLIAKSCLSLMHKVYLKVAPVNIRNIFNVVNTAPPRREPQIFSIPYNRLHNTDKCIAYVGPRLYNRVAIAINNNKPIDAKRVQNNFLNPYKCAVNKYLLEVQALGPDIKTWNAVNFALHDTTTS